LRQPQELAHVPDLLTFDGVVDLLSVCNLFEMANALSYEAYTPQNLAEYDRTHFIQARKLCREMVHWASSRLLFVSDTGHDMDLHRLQMRYLATQSKALTRLRYQLDNVLPHSHVRGEALELALDMCFKGNEPYMKGLAEVVNHTPDNFEYPREWVFKVHPRTTPISTSGEFSASLFASLFHLILSGAFSGETYDDVVYFASLDAEIR
jgi:hypothetical protein